MTNEILKRELLGNKNLDFIVGGTGIQFIKDNIKIPPRPEKSRILKINDIPLITIVPFPYIREDSPKSFKEEM